MFIFPSSRQYSLTLLLQSHFTPLLLLGFLLFTFLLISSCLSLLMDSCMLIADPLKRSINTLLCLSSSRSCRKCSCALVFLALVIRGPEPAPSGPFSECCCSIAGDQHVLRLQEQHIHKNNKLQRDLRRTSIFCWDSVHCYLCQDSSHI